MTSTPTAVPTALPTSAAPGAAPSAPPARPRLVLSRTERKLAGVAGGLAEHTGLDPVLWRLAFVGLTVTGGVGVLLYGLLWLLVPRSDEPA